jgi:ketosteroid isomerase-like protein
MKRFCALLPTALLPMILLSGCVTTTTTTPGATSAPTRVRNTPAPSPPPKPAADTSASLSGDATAAAVAAATRQVVATEQAFAKTMADRDFKAFVTFLSPDAVFFSGSDVTRGPVAVAAKWETYFAGREAPFSWTPDHVEVLASGGLALSTGPVFQNHKIVGRFSSIWRLEGNSWHVVFDKGEAVCGMTP